MMKCLVMSHVPAMQWSLDEMSYYIPITPLIQSGVCIACLVRSVSRMTLVLFQTIQYITKNKVMETESRELAAVSRGKIKVGSTDDWKSEQLFVPPLPPTNLRGCHLIRIQYDVFVSLKSSQHHHQSDPHSTSFHKIGPDNKTFILSDGAGNFTDRILKPSITFSPLHFTWSHSSLLTNPCHIIRMLHIFGS